MLTLKVQELDSWPMANRSRVAEYIPISQVDCVYSHYPRVDGGLFELKRGYSSSAGSV